MGAFRAEAEFRFDERLGIPVPDLKREWEQFSVEEQGAILYYWETVRGRIPERILALEREIVSLQQRLEDEDDFDRVCAMNWEIAERASRINDLHICYRLGREVAVKGHDSIYW